MKKSSVRFPAVARRLVSVIILFSIMIVSGSSADQFTPSHVTYDTTYEKILKMYLKVINGYRTANYGRHDLFNDMLFGGMEGWETREAVSYVKSHCGFMLYDVNQDGIDELLIGSGGGSLNEVFTMDNDKVRELIRAGGYGTASSEYSCALLADGMFFRHGHDGAGYDFYETWQMNETGKVSYVEGYHTEAYWDSDSQTGGEYWYRSSAPMSKISYNQSKRVEASVAENWVKTQEWNIFNKKFVPFSVYEKYPDDPWNVGVLSVKGATNSTAKVNIRKEMDQKSKLVATKNVGTYVKVVTKEGEYFKIAFDNKEGYVHQDYLTPLTYEISAEDIADTFGDLADIPVQDETPEQDTTDDGQWSYPLNGTTASANVNVRAETSKKSKLIATIKKKGTAVTVNDEYTDIDGTIWYQVEYNGKEGCVRNDFIELKTLVKSTATSGEELYGLVIKKLATRSGPSPRAEDTGTYSVKGKKLRVYTRAYDPIENAWWVKCDVPYHGEIRTLWAWYTRFDSKTLPLESIPIDEEYR